MRSLVFPEQLKQVILNSNQVFLSASPILELTDLTLSVENLSRVASRDIMISSLQRLQQDALNSDTPIIVVCGDVSLREMPSYLNDYLVQNNSENPLHLLNDVSWVAIRMTSLHDHVTFDYLSSVNINEPDITLFDTSWQNVSTLNRRLSCCKNVVASTFNQDGLLACENLQFIS